MIRILLIAGAAFLLSGCGTTNLAEQATALAKAVEIMDAGCAKTVEVNIQAAGFVPPSGNLRVTKTCDRREEAPAAVWGAPQ